MKMVAELKVGKPGAAFPFPGNCNGFIDPDMFDAEVWKASPGRPKWNRRASTTFRISSGPN